MDMYVGGSSETFILKDYRYSTCRWVMYCFNICATWPAEIAMLEELGDSLAIVYMYGVTDLSFIPGDK